MFAQRGMFTVCKVPLYGLQNEVQVDRRPLDIAIAEDVVKTEGPIFYRFTLPTLQSVRLMQLLYRDGYRAGLLFPTYEGSVEEVAEHMRVYGE